MPRASNVQHLMAWEGDSKGWSSKVGGRNTLAYVCVESVSVSVPGDSGGGKAEVGSLFLAPHELARRRNLLHKDTADDL